MKTKNLVMLALLVGIGAVLHAVIPPLVFGMKPDMMLVMMFLGIILFPEIKNVLLLGIVTGILSALTTGFPGGQLPNIIDKLVTAFVFYGLFIALKKFKTSIVGVCALTIVGTIISGTVFLTAATVIAGFTGPLSVLFLTVVLPAAAFNTVAMIIMYPVAASILKRTKISSASVIQK